MVEALVLQLAGLGDDTWGWADLTTLDVQMVVYDPTFASQMAANWDAAELPAVELRARASNLNVPFNTLIAAVEDGRVINDGNPVMTWMAGNTLLKQVQGGDYIYPAKLVPEDKIDGVAALINALWPLSQAPEDEDASERRSSFFEALGA
nr:terminase TerL endonuclease subunit [Falsiruegeria litorea]